MTMTDGTRITNDALQAIDIEHAREEILGRFEAYTFLGGCDVVLGIQWLAELGLILWDSKNLRMKFIVDGRKFALRGATIGPNKLVSIDRIQKDLRHIS